MRGRDVFFLILFSEEEDEEDKEDKADKEDEEDEEDKKDDKRTQTVQVTSFQMRGRAVFFSDSLFSLRIFINLYSFFLLPTDVGCIYKYLCVARYDI